MMKVNNLKTKIAIWLAGYDFTKPVKPVDYTGRAIILGDSYIASKSGVSYQMFGYEGIHAYAITNDRNKGIYVRFYEEKKSKSDTEPKQEGWHSEGME